MNNSILTRHYQNFSGIDLASDPTLCAENRSPFMLNMYKDYSNSFGRAIETVPGFRKRIKVAYENGDSAVILAMHSFSIGGEEKLMLHTKEGKLYLIEDISEDYGINASIAIKPVGTVATLPFEVFSVTSVIQSAESVPFTLLEDKKSVVISSTSENELLINYIKKSLPSPIYENMSDKKSVSVFYDGKLYILDGEKILVYSGGEVKEVAGYIPTTFSGISKNSVGEQMEFRNMLSDYFYNKILGDGETKVFQLSEREIESVEKVEVYGEVLSEENYSVDLTKGEITFNVAPESPFGNGFDEGFAGIILLLKRKIEGQNETILKMRNAVHFDGRLFLSGNLESKNTVCFSAFSDFSYFPEVNFLIVGGEQGEISGFLPSGGELLVFKKGSSSSIYRLTPIFTDKEAYPKAYSAKGMNLEIDCFGEGINFLGTPVFTTALGLKALAASDLKLERGVEHRSGMIDSEIIAKGLDKGRLFEFNGYLALYIDGNIYLGDSRARFINQSGELELEWFKVGKIATYENQYNRYVYSSVSDSRLEGLVKCADSVLLGKTANEVPFELGGAEIVQKQVEVDGKTIKYAVAVTKSELAVNLNDGGIEYEEVVEEFLVEKKEDMIGGDERVADVILPVGNNIYFSSGGYVCSFNFDKFDNGFLPNEYYNFDGRSIYSCVSTCLDNAGYPNMRKSSVKKSLIIKCKTKLGSVSKVKVRTDKKGYELVAIINNGYFDFNAMRFDNLSFNTSDQQIFVCNEKEKNWVEKQILVYSDELNSPFCIYYLTYQFFIKGKIKKT